MSDSTEDKRAGELIQAYLDGSLSRAEEAELRDWLRGDPSHMAEFVRQVHMHATLSERAIGADAEAWGGVPARRRAAWWGWGLAAAAAAVVALGAWWGKGRVSSVEGKEGMVVASVEQVSGFSVQCSGKEKRQLRVGDEVREGMRIETGEGGRVKMAWVGEGTTVEVGEVSGVRCQVSGGRGKSLFLEKGRLAAVVAKQPADKPFVVETPQARAIVVGTMFTLRANASRKSEVGSRKAEEEDASAIRNLGSVALAKEAPQSAIPSTWLEVEEGKVRLTRLADGEAIEVAAGHFAVAGAKAEDYALKTYTNGTEWVEGPVLFRDDFQTGLDAWLIRIEDDDGNTRPADEAARACVGIVKVARGPVTDRCLEVDASRLAGQRINLTLKEAFVHDGVAFLADHRFSAPGKEGASCSLGCVFDVPSSSRILKDAYARPRLEIWQTMSNTYVTSIGPDGQTVTDWESNVDGSLRQRGQTFCQGREVPRITIRLSVRNMKLTVARVELRQLVRKQRLN